MTDSPPLPDGWTADFTAEGKALFSLFLRIFEMCDIFSNADHNLLRYDNAAAMGLGNDVRRLYMTRAYRFNTWGLRSMAYVRTAVAAMQSSQATNISALSSFVSGADFAAFYQLEFKSLFFDCAMLRGDISRPSATRLVAALAQMKQILDDDNVTGLIDFLEDKLEEFETARETLFDGVANSLMAGNLPSVTWDPAASIHVYAPFFKAVPAGIGTLVCIVLTSENCQRWKWLNKLTQEIIREDRECRETEPAG